MKTTSTDYRRPHRPLLVRGVNSLLAGPLARSRLAHVSLSESSLLEGAERATGLLDLGDPSFREPFRKLLASLETEAQLSPVGRFILRERIVSGLANRMRIEEEIRENPGIVSERIGSPIVIVGLQRTGTTLLHRLLASDRRIRALASWEALCPARLAPPGKPDPRIANAQLAERSLKYLAPDFFAVHPVEAAAPEEDVLLLDLSFRSTVPEATLRVPTYARWLEDQDQTPAYRMLERALQVLQAQRMADRWVLKTPHHLEWLDVLLSVFPDALVVWTHREPASTVASFCSMVAHGRGVFSDRVDPVEIGRDWSRKVKRMVERAMAAREAAGERYFVDVRYDDLVRDPIAQVRRIYERAGMAWTRDGEVSMKDLLRTHTQHRFGEHRYRLEDFGLDRAQLDQQLAAYRSRFLRA